MTQQPIKSNPQEEKEVESYGLEFSMDNLTKDQYDEWMGKLKEAGFKPVRSYTLQEQSNPSLAEENRRLREAAKELLHLHSCEQEGLQSGKPTFEMWFNAVNKLSEALAGDAGNKEETKK